MGEVSMPSHPTGLLTIEHASDNCSFPLDRPKFLTTYCVHLFPCLDIPICIPDVRSKSHSMLQSQRQYVHLPLIWHENKKFLDGGSVTWPSATKRAFRVKSIFTSKTMWQNISLYPGGSLASFSKTSNAGLTFFISFAIASLQNM